MKKTLFIIAATFFAATAVACNGKLTASTGSTDSAVADPIKAETTDSVKPEDLPPVIEPINDDWVKVTYTDLGFSFEAPAGVKPDEDFGRLELRARSKGIFITIVSYKTRNATPDNAEEFLSSFIESAKKFTKECKAEQKGVTATIWEHKNGMQHHTRFIVGNGRYVKLIYYYFDDKKDKLDKTVKRVFKTMKLEDPNP